MTSNIIHYYVKYTNESIMPVEPLLFIMPVSSLDTTDYSSQC